MAAAKRNVSDIVKDLRSAIESRVFCSTGKGGGKDSSCSPKDAGGGGSSVQELSEPVAIGRNGSFPFAPEKNDLGKPPKFAREDAREDDPKDFAGSVAKDAGLPAYTEPGSKPGYASGETAWHSVAMPAVAVSKLEKSGYKKVAVAKGKSGKTVTYLEKNRGKSGRDPTGAEASPFRSPGDRHSVVVVSQGIYNNESGSQITAYASDMTYDSLSAGRRRGSGRSADPVVESRSLSVERRSFAVEAEDGGEPLLRIESRCECEGGGEETKREYIVGYAAKFGVNSLDLGKFIERIAPSAFRLVTERRGRKKTLDTRALFNHNADLPLAKHPGTLKLSVDDVGLRYEFPVPDTSYGRDLATNIRDGIVTGSSFSFTVPKGGEEWSMEEGRSIRTVTRVDSLIDVGPVTYPAYPDTDAAVAQRSYEKFMKKKEYRVFCSTGAGGGKDSSCSPKDAGGGSSGKDGGSSGKDGGSSGKDGGKKEKEIKGQPSEEAMDRAGAAQDKLSDKTFSLEEKVLGNGGLVSSKVVDSIISKVDAVKASDPESHELIRQSGIAEAFGGFGGYQVGPRDYSELPDKLTVYRLSGKAGDTSSGVYASDRGMLEDLLDDLDDESGKLGIQEFTVGKNDISYVLPNAEDDGAPGIVIKGGSAKQKGGGSKPKSDKPAKGSTKPPWEAKITKAQAKAKTPAAKKAKKQADAQSEKVYQDIVAKKKRSLFANRGQAVKQAQRSYERFLKDKGSTKMKESRVFCSTGAGGGKDSSCSPKDAGGGGGGGAATGGGSGSPGGSDGVAKGRKDNLDRLDAKYAAKAKKAGLSTGGFTASKTKPGDPILIRDKGSAVLGRVVDVKRKGGDVTVKVKGQAKVGGKTTGGAEDVHTIRIGKKSSADVIAAKTDHGMNVIKKMHWNKRSLFANHRGQAVKQAKLLRRSITRLAAVEIRAVLKKHGS